MADLGNPTPQTLNFSTYMSGDTLNGFQLSSVTFNGVTPPYPLVSCHLVFKDVTNTHFFRFSNTPRTGEGQITINNAATWAVTVEPTIINLPNGDYTWDWVFVDSNGTVRTLLAGKLPIRKGIANGCY
jgi:hypothetical protein